MIAGQMLVKAGIEASSRGKLELPKGGLREVSETHEVSEILSKGLDEATKILRPDMEAIKTQSLEAVKESNLEKSQISVKEDVLRELNAKERQDLGRTRLSETAIESIRVDPEGNYHLKCRNEELAGRNHEVTGVKYVEKNITVDGVEISVVVPEFPAAFECEIPPEMWENGDREIFRECTEQLRAYLEENPEKGLRFNEQQLEQIMNGEPYIRGYTWHHSEISGKMQLVETKIHAMSGHTGGNSIWCGGIR